MPDAPSPFQKVLDDLGCRCACHTGIGSNTACGHCRPPCAKNTTLVIDNPCRPDDGDLWSEEPCWITQLDHYGLPTPHLWCREHAKTVGYVVP